MYIRNPQPSTIALMNKLYRMKQEGKTGIQIEAETKHNITMVYAYISWLRKHPEHIEKQEGGEQNL